MTFISSFILLFTFKLKAKMKQTKTPIVSQTKTQMTKIKSDVSKKSELKLGGMRLVEDE